MSVIDSETETVTVSRALSKTFDRSIFFYTADRTLESGETIYWQDLSNSSYYSGSVRVFTISYTGWGDYVGTTTERANFVALSRDYPELFLTVRDTFGSETLALFAGQEIPVSLAEALSELRDYPLYDEETSYEIEQEIAYESWDSYLDRDFKRSVEELISARFNREIPSHIETLIDSLSDEWLKERFFELVSDAPEPYSAESAVSVVFPYIEDHAEIVAGEIVAYADALVMNAEHDAYSQARQALRDSGQTELF